MADIGPVQSKIGTARQSLRPENKRFLEAHQSELTSRLAATRLRNLLRMNTSFSVVSGLVGLVAAQSVADLLGIEEVGMVRLFSGVLLAFAAAVFTVASSRTKTLQKWSVGVSLADFTWVLASAAVITAGWLPPAGAAAMCLVGLPVLALGVTQTRARARLATALDVSTSGLDESPPVEIVLYEHELACNVEDMWPVISDHGLYARLALNLSGAANVTPNGPGFERTCTDVRGRTWSETCTLWNPGRRFDVDIDIADYPYPLQMVQGSWQIESSGMSSTTVAMVFGFQPKRGLYGSLFVSIMHLMFRPILRRIAKGWERAARETSSGSRTSS